MPERTLRGLIDMKFVIALSFAVFHMNTSVRSRLGEVLDDSVAFIEKPFNQPTVTRLGRSSDFCEVFGLAFRLSRIGDFKNPRLDTGHTDRRRGGWQEKVSYAHSRATRSRDR